MRSKKDSTGSWLPVPKVYSTYVPPTGSLSSKIMFVGEAPGKDEEREGEPFVGMAGQFLMRYLGRVGISRGDGFFTNLSKYRPEANKFKNLLGSPELVEGLRELSEEIERVDPHLIISLGRWPMYYMTGCTAGKGKPGTGIMLWRGSVVEGSPVHVPSAEGRKVLCTLHPSFVMRPGGFWSHPIFFNDLKRIKFESTSKDFNYPKYLEHIDPPNAEEIAHEMSQSDWLTVDIETFGQSLACVGFADSVSRGMCITYENPNGWDIVRELLATQQSKIFQFGAFDINWLWWFYQWEVEGYAFDTYIAAANLMPEFKRGLDFLTSVYTPMPYYKEDRQVWKQTDDQGMLWRYNLKDVIATHWIAMEQMTELEELYGQN